LGRAKKSKLFNRNEKGEMKKFSKKSVAGTRHGISSSEGKRARRKPTVRFGRVLEMDAGKYRLNSRGKKRISSFTI